MEDMADDIFLKSRQVASRTKTKVRKPPTRLQKQAPASLLLDQATGSGGSTNSFEPSSGHASNTTSPIPLLTPLAASPPPLPQEEEEEFRFPVLCNDINHGAYPEAGDRPHPATTSYGESSSLFTLFQSKCVLVNDA